MSDLAWSWLLFADALFVTAVGFLAFNAGVRKGYRLGAIAHASGLVVVQLPGEKKL